MALPPIGPTVVKFRKVLWFLAGQAAQGLAYLQFDEGQEIQPVDVGGTGVSPDEWRRFRCSWEDTVSLDPADTQQFKLDIVNYTNGNVDSTWTSADHTTCANAIAAFVNEIKIHVVAHLTCTRIHAYRMAFNPYTYSVTDDNGKVTYPPFVDSGAPSFVMGPAVAGSALGTVGPQECSTITLETASRKNWGRIYSPTIGVGSISAGGRLATGAVDGLAAAMNTLVDTLAASEFFIVVPTTQADSKPTRTLQHVSGIRVDDVLDVQRRRRHHTAIYRKIYEPALAALPAPPDELAAA